MREEDSGRQVGEEEVSDSRNTLDYETPPPPPPTLFPPEPPEPPEPDEYANVKRLLGAVISAGFGLLATYVEMKGHATLDRFLSAAISLIGVIFFALVAMGVVR